MDLARVDKLDVRRAEEQTIDPQLGQREQVALDLAVVERDAQDRVAHLNDYIENEKYDEDYGINALEVCEGLVRRGSFKDTYITDKPKIYPYVANYLDYLVAQGYLVMISDLGTENKIYTKAV